jgi:putative ubiquitin-RnfH superfamily antitoxin RatB of RatAB toxin-antitoxin module
MSNNEITIELVFAMPETQSLTEFRVEPGTTVADAIEQSGVYALFADVELRELPVGIWGRLVDRDRLVRHGDRIEIYRQLEIDPREARRQLAEAGRTMGRTAGRSISE